MDLFIGLVALFFFLLLFKFFYFNNIFNNFILFYFFYLSFFSPFLLSHVVDRVLVLRLGVRPETLRWES